MITNKNQIKTVTKHISCDCKCKFNSKKCNKNEKWNNKTYKKLNKNSSVKKIIVGILAHVFVRIKVKSITMIQ